MRVKSIRLLRRDLSQISAEVGADWRVFEPGQKQRIGHQYLVLCIAAGIWTAKLDDRR